MRIIQGHDLIDENQLKTRTKLRTTKAAKPSKKMTMPTKMKTPPASRFD